MIEKTDLSGKRHHPRLESLCLVSFVMSESETVNSPIRMARTLNISASGLKMEANEPLTPDSWLNIEIAIKETIFLLKAQVQYCRKLENGNYVIGVQFDQPNEEIPKAIL